MFFCVLCIRRGHQHRAPLIHSCAVCCSDHYWAMFAVGRLLRYVYIRKRAVHLLSCFHHDFRTFIAAEVALYGQCDSKIAHNHRR